MAREPVTFDLPRPMKMQRSHIFLRLLILVVVSWTAGSSGIFGLLYLALPVVVAVLIAQRGGERFCADDGPRVIRWLAFIVDLLAYLAMLTDELPVLGRPSHRLEVSCSGTPTVASALWRIVTALPSALVLALIGTIGWLLWIVAAVWILFTETYAEPMWRFQRALVRWEARLLVYLASLVESYPPFSLELGPRETIGSASALHPEEGREP